jgi:transcriptional regulator of arginine metabolism
MQKEIRQNAIISLIQAINVATQEELTSHLQKGGLFVNQSSISRDLDDLGIVKVNGYYALPERSESRKFGLYSLENAGDNIIVAKCDLGLASAICVSLDKANITEIIGTIAGEDTIFIAVRNHKEQKIALKKIWELFEK